MIHVTAALIIQEDKVLIARKRAGKPLAGYWEFPGGKVEPGETKEACLVRELKEEMGIDIEVEEYVGVSEYDYGDKVVALYGYSAKLLKGEIQLTDHDHYEWVEVSKLLEYPLAPADIPLAKAYVVAVERSYIKEQVKNYIESAIDKKQDLIGLDNFIVEQAPMLDRRLLLHGNSPMIGYGKLKAMDKKHTREWPLIGIAIKKNYISIFVAASRNGTPLPQIYAECLGKVGIGKHSIKMRHFKDLDGQGFSALIQEAVEWNNCLFV